MLPGNIRGFSLDPQASSLWSPSAPRPSWCLVSTLEANLLFGVLDSQYDTRLLARWPAQASLTASLYGVACIRHLSRGVRQSYKSHSTNQNNYFAQLRYYSLDKTHQSGVYNNAVTHSYFSLSPNELALGHQRRKAKLQSGAVRLGVQVNSRGGLVHFWESSTPETRRLWNKVSSINLAAEPRSGDQRLDAQIPVEKPRNLLGNHWKKHLAIPIK